MGRNHNGTSNWYQIKNANRPADLRWVNLDHFSGISAAVSATISDTDTTPRRWTITLHGGVGTHDLRLDYDYQGGYQDELECLEEMIMPPLDTK